MMVHSQYGFEPPPFRRVVVTIPPAHWFHGIALELTGIYRSGLKSLGIEVFDVPVEAFLPPDLGRIARLRHALADFRPELAIGLSHGSYALICRMPPGRDGHRPNFFTEVLDLPTVCLWDHAPMELANNILGQPPEGALDSQPGAMAALRRTLNHPRIVHWSRDRQQSRIMVELGLADANRIVHAPAPALPPFTDHRAQRDEAAAGVGFIGNLHQAPAPEWEAEVRALAAGALGVFGPGMNALGGGANLWDALADGIDAMTPDARARLRLTHDQTFFWRFTHRFILHDAQTLTRLAALGAAGVPVKCIGHIEFSAAGIPANLLDGGGPVGFATGLPTTLWAHEIILDVLNPGFIEGYSHKPVLGFAAGGFMLLNRVNGFIESFGDAGKAASWTSLSDLASKIDHYLSRPALRQEIGDTIRAEIAARHTLAHVLRRVLDVAAELRGPRPRSQVMAVATVDDSDVGCAGEQLLPRWRTHAHWQGASLSPHPHGLALVCGTDAWAYAAELPLTAVEASAGLLIRRLCVQAGRIAVTIVPVNCQEVLYEVVIGPSSPGAVEIDIPLAWSVDLSVILRNADEGASLVVLSASRLVEALPT
jgi:Glycosyl transferases group 1